MSVLVAFRLTLLILLIVGHAESRFLRLNSSDQDEINLISDGVEKQTLSAPSTCDHQYNFLPCAENAAGYMFLIVVYQGLLSFGEKQRDQGTKVLSQILGVGKFGGIIFGILNVLPSMLFMIVSGVFSGKQNAKSQVSVGVGIYAGITVFSVTIQWGICVISGRKNLVPKPNDQHVKEAPRSRLCFAAEEKLVVLQDSGVEIDRRTRYMGGFMLLSLIPYVIVQIVAHNMILVALAVSVSCLAGYFYVQYSSPWIQQRCLDYSKYELLRQEFLKHVEKQGKLVNEDGTLNTDAILKLFSETDQDADKRITRCEVESMVLKIVGTGKMQLDTKAAVADVMGIFNFNDDSIITEEEFINGCKVWIEEANQLPQSSDSSSKNIIHDLFQLFKDNKEVHDPRELAQIKAKIMKHAESQLLKSESLVTDDGKPNIEQIRILFKKFDSDGNKSISIPELEKLITTVKFGEFKPKHEDIMMELFKDFDQDNNNIIDEPEFVEGFGKWLEEAVQVTKAPEGKRVVDLYDKIVWKEKIYNKWDFIKSVLQVLLGIVMLTCLGGPLMTNILNLSHAMSVPSFCISFVVVPIAMNAKAAMVAIWRANEKTEGTASLTFSGIYGGVVMNNLMGLTTLLALVYAYDLTWDFSAEVLTILVVCGIVGILAYSRGTYRLWTCIVAFLLYPFSLALFYYFQVFLSWNLTLTPYCTLILCILYLIQGLIS